MAAHLAETLASGYARLLTGGEGGGVVGLAALLWVEGPDAESFLQGLVTNDVAALPVAGSAPALLLSAKGRIQADLRVVRDGEQAFTLVTDPDQAEGLAAMLDRYHFSEEIELLGPEAAGLLTVGGRALERVRRVGGHLVVPGRIAGTVDLVGDDPRALLSALDAPEADPAALEALRIEAGVPRFGADMTAASLVQEVGLDQVAVSFDKGCYLGQETVARTRYRGHVNRRLRGLLLAEPTTAGAPVSVEGREVGRVTSAAVSPARGPVALAILHRDVADGDPVAVEGSTRPARVVPLPFP